jgi:hypothetical protein
VTEGTVRPDDPPCGEEDKPAVTPAEQEATLIALWNEGLETAEIAQRLGTPRGTVQSRAYRLQQQGKIQPRPRGGPILGRKRGRGRGQLHQCRHQCSPSTPVQCPVSTPV